jgi:hypothetical protein
LCGSSCKLKGSAMLRLLVLVLPARGCWLHPVRAGTRTTVCHPVRAGAGLTCSAPTHHRFLAASDQERSHMLKMIPHIEVSARRGCARLRLRARGKRARPAAARPLAASAPHAVLVLLLCCCVAAQVGPWVLQQAVGSTPVIVGTKLETSYHLTGVCARSRARAPCPASGSGSVSAGGG